MIPFHPLADLFPLIEGAEFEAFAADVKANGLRQKILIRQGQILDGRNRYRALVAGGLVDLRLAADKAMKRYPAWFSTCDQLSERDAVARVVSLNISRRHLSESQRALVAARLAGMKHGGKRRGGIQGANWPLEKGEATPPAPVPGAPSPEGEGSRAVAEAAEMLNVGARSVKRAKALIETGPAAAVADVAAGKTAVSTALDMVREVVARAGPEPDPAEVDRLYRALNERRKADKAAAAEAKKAARAAREQQLGQRMAGGNAELEALGARKKYGVILADPEWDFELWGEGGMDRSAENHYPCSPLETIKARPVAALAAQDCVLFLWATAPGLAQALEVMTAWGFAYKTNAVWDKRREGTGYWFRNRHEHLLVGVRGKPPCPAPGTQRGSVIDAPAGAHSQKPEAAHAMIEAYFPSLPKIELNARQARAGWDRWGAEAPEARSSEGGRSPAEVRSASGKQKPSLIAAEATPPPDLRSGPSPEGEGSRAAQDMEFTT